MLEKSTSLLLFQHSIMLALNNFQCLSLSEQHLAIKFLNKCTKDLEKNMNTFRTAKTRCNESDKETPQHKSLNTNANSVLTARDVENQLNVLDDENVDFLESIADDKDEAEESATQKHIDSIVEKLDKDDTLNSDISMKICNEESLASTANLSESQSCSVDTDRFAAFEYKDSDNSSEGEADTFKEISSEVLDKLICILCRCQFISKNALIEHLLKHQGKSQTCIECKREFDNAITYKLHLISDSCKNNKLNLDDLESIWVGDCLYCSYCGKRYDKSVNFHSHYNFCEKKNQTKNLNKDFKHDKTGKVQCSECDMTFRMDYELKKHMKSHVPVKYFCDVCELPFTKRDQFREHMKAFKNNEKHIAYKKKQSQEHKVWCSVCEMSLANEKTYKRHCDSERHMKMSDTPVLETQTFVCDKCPRTFNKKYNLICHQYKVHTERDLLTCGLCEYSTRNANNLNRHKIDAHGSQKPFACDRCPSFFKNKAMLKQHITGKHMEGQLFSCDTCDIVVKSSFSLKRHQKTHDSVRTLQCNHCDSKFSRKTHLKRHNLVVHKDEMKAEHDGGVDNQSKTIYTDDPMMVEYDGNQTSMDFNDNHSQSNLKAQDLIYPEIVPTISNTNNNDVFPVLDVHSGELMVVTVNDVLKDNLWTNLSNEPSSITWTNPGNEIFNIVPINEPTYILQTNDNIEPINEKPENILDAEMVIPEHPFITIQDFNAKI